MRPNGQVSGGLVNQKRSQMNGIGKQDSVGDYEPIIGQIYRERQDGSQHGSFVVSTQFAEDGLENCQQARHHS